MKTRMSRFQIHDDLTAPEGSQPLLRGALSTGGQLPNVVGVLAGAPAALRGYARLRSELRHGHLEPLTLERIALAVAEHHGAAASIALHTRAARRSGMALDDIALAREWEAHDARDAALLRYLKPLVTQRAAPLVHLHEEARELGWTDEQLLEAVAFVALESLTSMVNVAGDVPPDGSVEEARHRPLRAA
jgi:alkylhydroperoxidase family enzyme